MKKRIHISSGRGPDECTLVVAKVLKELLKDAKKQGFSVEVLKRVEGAMPTTLVSVVVEINGANTSSFISAWTGAVLWIGQSPYRKFHKRKNWFVEVRQLEISKDEQLKIEDIKFQATKSSGPGGQHVNKTSSAIRATHVPTGLSVLVQDSRSQHQNKKIAIQRLTELHGKGRVEELKTKEVEEWKMNVEVQRGNPVKVFEGIGFKLRR